MIEMREMMANPQMRVLVIQQDCIYCPIAMAALNEIRLHYNITPERDVRILNSDTNRGEYIRIIEYLKTIKQPQIELETIGSFPLLIYDRVIKSGISSRLAWERILYQEMVA